MGLGVHVPGLFPVGLCNSAVCARHVLVLFFKYSVFLKVIIFLKMILHLEILCSVPSPGQSWGV